MRPLPRTLSAELSNDELSSLINIIREKSFKGKHLEIGTAAGGTLCCMMKAFEDRDRPPFVVIDPMTYFQDQLNIIRKNLQDNGVSPDGIDFRVMKSNEAFIRAKQDRESFDFIFIDGAHKVNYVTDDLRWAGLLNTGGILCLHDTNVKGVGLAANRFLRNNPHYVTEKYVDTLLVLCKTKESESPEISLIDRAWASTLAPLLRLEVFTKKLLKRRNGKFQKNKFHTPL